MNILNQLQQNKGAVSSKLGKELAEKVLKGDNVILKEAVQLCSFNDKNVRAGAAKIIEKVAEKKPELVSSYLKELFPALDSPEPQTRWMIIYAFGYCAKLNPDIAVL
ncbi:MAG: HEAT repeat domain-containing protein [Candidatus Micrarchaeota archaeon]